ncbi:MAG: uroporphyrinogen-III synthase [Actinomycetota bacterium]|nr:uroporphyrinogen-III synthase [Actinomycetota bacterium]
MSDGPLAGRTVVVTRSEAQAPDLVGILGALGAETVQLPAIRIGEPADGGERLRAAARRLADYDWVVFTSVNTVERFVPLLGRPPAVGTARVAAVGPGTARALARSGLEAELVPDRFVAESLLEAFPLAPVAPVPGCGRVLLPRAAVARDVLPEGLRAAGWEVDVVEAYRTELAHPSPGALAAAARADAITFTSPSTVHNYLEVAGTGAVPPVVACIGPVTAAAARDSQLHVDVVSEVRTMEGLAHALAAHLGRSGPPDAGVHSGPAAGGPLG